MTDRELLEKAAKAAGMTECGWMGPAFVYVNDKTTFVEWNPLTDDGDALRLAVKLCLNLSLSDVGSVDVDGVDTLTEDFGTGDPYAATRRAIVRAAAALVEKPQV
jgi:hypothetical protein